MQDTPTTELEQSWLSASPLPALTEYPSDRTGPDLAGVTTPMGTSGSGTTEISMIAKGAAAEWAPRRAVASATATFTPQVSEKTNSHVASPARSASPAITLGDMQARVTCDSAELSSPATTQRVAGADSGQLGSSTGLLGKVRRIFSRNALRAGLATSDRSNDSREPSMTNQSASSPLQTSTALGALAPRLQTIHSMDTNSNAASHTDHGTSLRGRTAFVSASERLNSAHDVSLGIALPRGDSHGVGTSGSRAGVAGGYMDYTTLLRQNLSLDDAVMSGFSAMSPRQDSLITPPDSVSVDDRLQSQEPGLHVLAMLRHRIMDRYIVWPSFLACPTKRCHA
jgi:hypothetical protein